MLIICDGQSNSCALGACDRMQVEQVHYTVIELQDLVVCGTNNQLWLSATQYGFLWHLAGQYMRGLLM